MAEFTIVERTEPFTLDEVFDFIDDTNIGKIDAHELKCRIVDMVQAERNKAIYECYMKAKTMMEELAYQNQGRRNGKIHRMYCMQALDFLRQVAEQMKGEQHG